MAASRIDSNIDINREDSSNYLKEINYNENEKKCKDDIFIKTNIIKIIDNDDDDNDEKNLSSNRKNSFEEIRKVLKIDSEPKDDDKLKISDCDEEYKSEEEEEEEDKKKDSLSLDKSNDRRSSKFQRQIRGLRKQARIITTATIEEDKRIDDDDDDNDDDDDRTIDRNDLENNLTILDSSLECSVKDRNLIGNKVDNHHRTLKESIQERINPKKSSSSCSSSTSTFMKNRISSVKRTKCQLDKDIEFRSNFFTNSTTTTSSSSYFYLNKEKKIKELKKCFNCGEQYLPYRRYSYIQKYSINLDNELNGVYEKQGTPSTKLILTNNVSVRDSDSRLETPVTSLLYRSRSLPRLSVHDSGVGCSANEQTVPGQGQHGTKQLVNDLRQLLTLKQHYYPEGGWGWLVILVGMLVQILSHGTQGAVGVFVQHVATRFGHHVYLESG